MTNAPEIWKSVVGFEGRYEVSDLGRVYSHVTKRLLKLTPLKRCGHIQVMLGGRWFRVHRMVLEAFVGPCPERHEGRHRNGRPGDNHLLNLQWALKRRNVQDRKWHALPSNYKLTPEHVRQIKLELKYDSQGVIAQRHCLHRNTVSNIKRGLVHADV